MAHMVEIRVVFFKKRNPLAKQKYRFRIESPANGNVLVWAESYWNMGDAAETAERVIGARYRPSSTVEYRYDTE